ncbi:hypothetical protein, partial [uncultured Bifidobacterium sp.]|uniref:hypothetical protein n=1 Tax=uncultured Bifidobacterium sp. TaxID=165187 RepID=UPI0028DBF369
MHSSVLHALDPGLFQSATVLDDPAGRGRVSRIRIHPAGFIRIYSGGMVDLLPSVSVRRRPLILDLDTGIDDAL